MRRRRGAAVQARLVSWPESRASRVVYGTTLLWAAAFSLGGILEQRSFLLRRYDLGNFTQALWSTAHGHLLEVTEVGGAQVSRLGIHVDPILLLLVPIWKLWPSPEMLLVVQAVALAAGSVPLFWLARKRLASERDAALIGVAYLACPTIGSNALHEFHAIALAVPLLLLAVWFLDEGRLAPFWVAAGLAMLCGEQVGFIVACLGIWYMWHHKYVARGTLVAVVGMLVSAVDFGFVLHHFSHGSPYYGRYAGVGGSLSGVLRNVFTDPLKIAHALQFSDLLAIVLLALPVLGLCFGSAITLVAAPQIALIMLSDRTADLDIHAQTTLPIIPFIYLGAVFTLARLRGNARFTAGHVLVTSVAAAVIFGPLSPFVVHLPTSSHLAAEQQAVSLIPASVPVSTTNHLGSHLAERQNLYVFPVIRKAEWVVVDATDPYLPDVAWLKGRKGIQVGTRDLYRDPGEMRSALLELNKSSTWKRVFFRSGVSVFERVPSRQ
jgi:uncharacterized membrane protein